MERSQDVNLIDSLTDGTSFISSFTSYNGANGIIAIGHCPSALALQGSVALFLDCQCLLSRQFHSCHEAQEACLLQNLKQLRTLNLSHTGFIDVAASQLDIFPELKFLNISGTDVTYEGLTHIAKLSLRKVDISKCKHLPFTPCSAKSKSLFLQVLFVCTSACISRLKMLSKWCHTY